MGTSDRESELGFPPPPRLVRRKAGMGCALALPRLFVLPHMIIGAVLLLSVPTRLYVERFGERVTATVDQKNTGTGRKGGITYKIFYHFDMDGSRVAQTTYVSAETYDRAQVGESYPGRASSVMGYVLFLGPKGWQQWGSLVMLGIAVVWNGLLSVFVYKIWVLPIRQRWILRFGESTPGRITGRRKVRGGGVSFFVSYAFTTPDGVARTNECRLTSQKYEAVEGTAVTVLYLPLRPKQNLVYEYCDFVVGEQMG